MQIINKLIVFCFVLLLGIVEQVHSQQVTTSENKTDAQFVFLNFHITKTNSNPNGEIRLVSHKVVKGTLKPINLFTHTGETNKYQITLKSNSGKVTSQTEIVNPLKEELEYPGENGTIGRVTIEKTEADFMVRLPYSSDCVSAIIKTDDGIEQVFSISSKLTPGK